MSIERGTGRSRCGALALVGAAVVLLGAGCGSAGSGPTEGSAPTPTHSMSPGMQMSPGMHMSTGTHMSGHHREAPRPSAAARMICSTEIRRDVARTFAESGLAPGRSTWRNSSYACTYDLPVGPLTLSVQDSTDEATGMAYFSVLRQGDGSPPLLRGLEAFGLPSYETSDGTVVFLKDGKTLEVDATSLPAAAGPRGESRNDVAYAVAADVIGCWSE